MAYRRASGSYKAKRRTKSSGRRSRYTGKTRRFRKTKRTSRPMMSKKRILNTTSTKKRNGMLTWTNQQQTQTALKQGPLILVGGPATGGIPNNIGYVLWRPTAMDLTAAGGGANSIVNVAQRTASTCYMRGVSEHIRVETSSGNPWFHRRICFTSRSTVFLLQNPSDPSGTERAQIATGAIETSNGFQRLAANMLVDTLPQTVLNQKGLLFKGAEGVDWDDVITAPLDTTRVDVKYDKTFTYRSGNASGILKEHKIWHPMNKNIVYDDDETGDTEATTTFSVFDKRGMGNYHILDLFSQGTSGNTADLLSIRYNSTLYWHEK